MNIPQIPWTPNHSTEQPCRLVVYDTETRWLETDDPRGRQCHRWRLAVGSLWKRKGDRWRKAETVRFPHLTYLWAWLYSHTRKREPLWVYAHNAAFDFTIAGGWNQIDTGIMQLEGEGRWYPDRRTGALRMARNWKGKLAVDTLPFIVEAKHDDKLLKFVDTMNYLPCSLDEIAKWLGMEKLPLPKNDASDADWYARCERDVEITEHAVMRLLELWKSERLGNWQETIAGLAYSSFRHVSPNSGIVAHGDEPATPEELYQSWADGTEPALDMAEVSALERRSYFAARTLTAFLGDVVPAEAISEEGELFGSKYRRPKVVGPVTCFDCNGLYAFVMSTCQFPIELMSTEIDVDLDRAERLAREFQCIARVRIRGRTEAYPVRDNGRTIWARGDFVTDLAGPELVRAFDCLHVDQCHQLAVYHSGRPFTKYVGYWWDKRLAAQLVNDTVTAKLCKNMINALFGKLGQRRPGWERVEGVFDPPRWGPFIADLDDGLGPQMMRAIAGVTQRRGERRDCRHTFTAAAAFVTAQARAFMDSVREALPPFSCVYQDTDSLFLLPSGRDALYNSGLVHPTAIGRFKNEGSYNFASFYGPKNYRKGGTDVVAGKRPGAVSAGERRWRQWHFERCKSIIGREPDGSVWSWQEVFSSPGSACGVTTEADGWTRPLILQR